MATGKGGQDMIDTVDLLLNADQFTILDLSVFDGRNIKGIEKRFDNEELFIKKKRDSIVKQGRYFPSLNLKIVYAEENGKRKRVIDSLMIQVSITKLLFSTSIFEADYTCREQIYKKLLECFREVGIETTREQLEKAILRRVAFSKIIRIPDHFGNARQVLKQLQGFDYKRSSKFRINYYGRDNDVFDIKFNNRTQSLVIYDKINEIDCNGYTLDEIKIKDHFQGGKIKNNVLKIELTFQKKQSMNAVLRRILGVKKNDFCLDDVLNEKVSKQALLEIFDDVFSNVNVILLSAGEMRENLFEQEMINAKISIKERAWLIYLVNNCTKFGVLETSRQLKEELKGGTFDRSMKELKLIAEKLFEIRELRGNIVAYLRDKLEEFKIIKG